jgi:hypothetical protein
MASSTHDSILAADRKSIGHFSCLDQLNEIRHPTLEHSLRPITDEGFFDEGAEKEQILHLVLQSSLFLRFYLNLCPEIPLLDHYYYFYF